MQMNEEMRDNILLITLGGELMGGEPMKPFQDRIFEAIRESKVQIVIDMKEVKWMNSSGLGTLMAGLTTLRSSDGDLKLVNVPDRVRRPIEVTKLDTVLRMYDSVDAAIQDFSTEE
jgi:anti-sigma B factor antagonist